MRLLILGVVVCLALVCLFMHSSSQKENDAVLQRKARYFRHLIRQEKVERCDDIIAKLYAEAATPGWNHALQLGKMYHRGCYPDFKPNMPMAVSIYNAIVSKCEDPLIVAEARGLAHQPPLLTEDVAGDPFPLAPGNQVLARIHAMIKVPPVVVRKRTAPPPVRVRTEIEQLIDTQNSHDHGVTASMKSIIDALRTEGIESTCNAKEEIERLLLSDAFDMTDEDKAKALAVLDSLRDTHTHSTLGVTETVALDLVWGKLTKLNSSGETLCKQLASGFERGTPVCSTGKIARIVSALDGITPEARIIMPVWAVKEELGSLAAKIRSDTLGSVSEMHRGAYERGEYLELEEKMRADFTRQALATYCESGLGMERSVVEPIVESIASGF
jgi:hypothetical protein